MYLGDFKEDGDIFFKFTTRAFATGIPTTLAGSPVLSVYKDEGGAATEKTTAEAYFDLDVDHDSIAGWHNVRIDLSGDAFFATGADYSVVITTGTVDSVNVFGENLANFSVENRSMGQPAGATLAADIAAIKAETSLIVGDTVNIQSRIPAALASGNMKSDVLAISGDTTSADNLELQYDTTGLTGDTFPATQSQVGNIGSSSGGSLSFQVETDNAITDTIDNAAAVDKGSGLVGIPVTSHAFTVDFQVTIASTTNYNGSFTIISETANEVVITATFVSETFGGSETIISTIKTIAKVGSEVGTFANTEALDATYHVLTNDGDNLDWVYQIDVGGGRTASLINFHGYLTGNNDTVNIQAYDFVGTDWETRAILQGTAQATDQTLTIPLLSKHTGLSGADIGKVLIRFVDATAAGHVLGVDELLVEAVGIGQTVGYANGQIWYNSVSGTAGTEAFVNGVADNPSLTLADVKTLSTSVGIGDFHVINGSTATLAESTVNESYFGDNWTLALGGQDVDGAYFQGAHVSGVGTSTTEVHYEGCDIGTMSVQIGHFDFCSFDGTVTQTLAGDYEYHNCYSNIAGTGAPTFTKTSGQAITAEWRNWMDSITVSGLESGDTITINGRLGTVTLNGADATVEIRGSYKSIVNNLTGSPTVNIDGAWKGKDIADIKVPTDKMVFTKANELDANTKSINDAEVVGDGNATPWDGA